MYSHTRMDLIKPEKRFIKSIFIYVPITAQRKYCIEPDYLRTQQKKTSKMLLLNAFFVAGPGIEPGTS